MHVEWWRRRCATSFFGNCFRKVQTKPATVGERSFRNERSHAIDINSMKEPTNVWRNWILFDLLTRKRNRRERTGIVGANIFIIDPHSAPNVRESPLERSQVEMFACAVGGWEEVCTVTISKSLIDRRWVQATAEEVNCETCYQPFIVHLQSCFQSAIFSFSLSNFFTFFEQTFSDHEQVFI